MTVRQNLDKCSPEALRIYNSMVNNSEGSNTKPDGSVWCDVYLDNCRGKESPHQFAGYLSALKAAGVYREVDGFAWGSVRTL